MNIVKNKKLVLQGKSNKQDGLWDVLFTPILKHHEHTIHFIVHENKFKLELAQYLHACAGLPVISSFQKVINIGILLHDRGLIKVTSTQPSKLR